VVRLAAGDPARQTTYDNDPLEWAQRWKSEGAKWLHVVNLDGALDGDAHLNIRALRSILSAGVPVELGGGIRDQSSITIALDMGVRRVFIGTAAIQNPALVDWAIIHYGTEHIAGDIGVRDGKVAIKGWQETTNLSVIEMGKRFKESGLTWCVLTDVQRDGLESGLNVNWASELQNSSGMQVVASGGVRDLDDIRRARDAGLAGVIVGRALYEGKIKLEDCLRIQTGT